MRCCYLKKHERHQTKDWIKRVNIHEVINERERKYVGE